MSEHDETDAVMAHWSKIKKDAATAIANGTAGPEMTPQPMANSNMSKGSPTRTDPALAAAQAEIARLREALAPFAKAGDLLVRAQDAGDFWAYRPAGGDEYGVSGKDLLAARAALVQS